MEKVRYKFYLLLIIIIVCCPLLLRITMYDDYEQACGYHAIDIS